MTNNVEGMQQLVDTKAKLTSYGTVLKDGEIMRLSDVDRVTIGDGVTAGKDRPVFLDSFHEGGSCRLRWRRLEVGSRRTYQ